MEENVFVALNHDVLDARASMDLVRSPIAGAIVLFAGTFQLGPLIFGSAKMSKGQLEITSTESMLPISNTLHMLHVLCEACYPSQNLRKKSTP